MKAPYSLPDNHEEILSSIAADANRQLAASPVWRDYVAEWESGVHADADTIALSLQNRRLRMTVFVRIPATSAWGYLTSSTDRAHVRAIVAERLACLRR